MLERYLTPWRVRWYSASILFSIFIGFMICVFYGTGSNTIYGRLGGDYPAFYSIGRIVAKGDLEAIYNPENQAAEQKPLMGDETGYLPFGYPPYVALFYWPLSLLSYRLSYVIHTFVMVLALLLLFHIMRPVSAEINKNFFGAFILSLCFAPIFRAITAGQNTIITMLLIALSWRAIEKKNDYVAGIFCGLMLFKPQFALPLIGVYLLSGRWRVGISSGMIAIILYVIGTFMIGFDWIFVWLEKAKWQVQLYAELDKLNAVSWLGFCEAVFGAGNQWALSLGWTLTLLTIIGISYVWWKGGRKGDLTSQMGLICISLVLIPPHVIFYDMGILLFTFIAIATRPLQRKIEILLIICILSWTQPIIARSIGFSPLFLVAIGTSLLAAILLVQPALEYTDRA